MLKDFWVRYVVLLITAAALGLIFMIVTGGAIEDLRYLMAGVAVGGAFFAFIGAWVNRGRKRR